MSRPRPILLSALAAAAGAVFVDQGAKWIILDLVMAPPKIIPVTPFFNLRLGFNTGVSFGMFADRFADAPLLLAALNLAVVGLLVLWIIRSKSRSEAVALGLIVGGALGNILDRWRQGAVTDFLDFHWRGWHWPAFNGADVFISLGVLMLLLAGFKPAPSPEMEKRQ